MEVSFVPRELVDKDFRDKGMTAACRDILTALVPSNAAVISPDGHDPRSVQVTMLRTAERMGVKVTTHRTDDGRIFVLLK